MAVYVYTQESAELRQSAAYQTVYIALRMRAIPTTHKIQHCYLVFILWYCK